MNEALTSETNADRQMLRHTLATVAYRGGKALAGAPPEFGSFRVGEHTRTPIQILAHINDLFDWGIGLARGEHIWHNSTPRQWDEEVARFYRGLAQFDTELASAGVLGFGAERIFQGPIADALTHIGQISMLRRLAGSPVKGENYFRARIACGQVGAEQSMERVEFD